MSWLEEWVLGKSQSRIYSINLNVILTIIKLLDDDKTFIFAV